MKLWQLSRKGDLVQVQVAPELISHLHITRTAIHETEYAKKGELAITASGLYGALSLNFPFSGAIERSSESGQYFTIRPSMDFDDLDENDISMEV